MGRLRRRYPHEVSDPPTQAPDLSDAHLPPRDPARQSSHRPLRPRDSMGALNLSQVQLDEAHATGYARGLGEAREEALDDLQTILSRIIETRFFDLTEPVLDCISQADRETLKKWIVSASLVDQVDDIFAR